MKESRAAKPWQLFLTLAIVLTIYSCKEESSIVGSSIVQTSENFQFDTLEVESFTPSGFRSFTGRLFNAATGSYNDQVYGQINTRTLVKPSITFDPGVEGIVNVSTINLRMTFDTLNVWGDSTQPTRYGIYRAESLWRGIAWKHDDQVVFNRTNPVATFERSREGTITVPLSDDWIAEFGTFYNAEEVLKDSLFSFEFNGLVIAPEDDATSNAISFLNIAETDFLITRDPNSPIDEETEFDIQDWAYEVERQNNPVPQDRLLLNSTNDVVFSSDFLSQLSQFSTSNIVNVDLVFYEDVETLSTNLPQDHVRIDANVLETHVGFGLDPNFDLTFGTSDSLGFRSGTANTFRFNITAYVNAFLFGEIDETEFFFSIVERSGLLSSTLLYNSNAANAAVRPKLIVTTLEE